MKKLMILGLVACLSVTSLVGCGKKEDIASNGVAVEEEKNLVDTISDVGKEPVDTSDALYMQFKYRLDKLQTYLDEQGFKYILGNEDSEGKAYAEDISLKGSSDKKEFQNGDLMHIDYSLDKVSSENCVRLIAKVHFDKTKADGFFNVKDGDVVDNMRKIMGINVTKDNIMFNIDLDVKQRYMEPDAVFTRKALGDSVEKVEFAEDYIRYIAEFKLPKSAIKKEALIYDDTKKTGEFMTAEELHSTYVDSVDVLNNVFVGLDISLNRYDYGDPLDTSTFSYQNLEFKSFDKTATAERYFNAFHGLNLKPENSEPSHISTLISIDMKNIDFGDFDFSDYDGFVALKYSMLPNLCNLDVVNLEANKTIHDNARGGDYVGEVRTGNVIERIYKEGTERFTYQIIIQR